MITFELSCENGHRFEGWFANREAFDQQLASAQITCPLCNSTEIEKLLSAVSVHTSKNSSSLPYPMPQAPAQEAGGGLERGGEPTAVQVPQGGPSGQKPVDPKQVGSFFSALSEFVEKNFEDVGDKFADEAIKMHRGEAEDRSIRGTSTDSEDEEMKDEGVEFAKMALPKYDA
jgi:hypothetical protein